MKSLKVKWYKMEKQSPFKKFIFSGSGWALFAVFVWELLEEVFESLLAYALSSGVAIFLTKILSTLAIITATQGLKMLIRRFLYPLIKNYIKEKNIKMKFINNIFKFIWANKITILSMIVGGVSGYFGAYYLAMAYLFVLPGTLEIYLIAGGTALICALLSIYLGGETIAEYVKRIAVQKLNKEDRAKIENAINTTLTAVELAKLELEKFEKAKLEAKAELLAKQESEIENLAKLKLENQNKTN